MPSNATEVALHMPWLRQIDAARATPRHHLQGRAYHRSRQILFLYIVSRPPNMSLSRRFHQLLAWLALCVMVFGAAAPTISRTLASNPQLTRMEVCSASGTKRVAVPGNRTAGQEKMPVDVAHCGYCVLQQHAPTPPSAAPAITSLIAVLAHPVFFIADVTVVPALAPTAHRSRAPPGLV